MKGRQSLEPAPEGGLRKGEHERTERTSAQTQITVLLRPVSPPMDVLGPSLCSTTLSIFWPVFPPVCASHEPLPSHSRDEMSCGSQDRCASEPSLHHLPGDADTGGIVKSAALFRSPRGSAPGTVWVCSPHLLDPHCSDIYYGEDEKGCLDYIEECIDKQEDINKVCLSVAALRLLRLLLGSWASAFIIVVRERGVGSLPLTGSGAEQAMRARISGSVQGRMTRS